MSLRAAPCVALLLAATAYGQADTVRPSSHDELFGIDRIWDVHIVVANDGWTGMHPDTQKKMGYGARFPYAKARVRIAGHNEIVAGLRFKGNSTYWKLPGNTLKLSFKLDFDRYVKGQKFLGLKKLCLNNNYYDTTQVREAISFKAYRDAGVPASRTAFARVYLTITGRAKGKANDKPSDKGKVENEYLGLYTLIEQPDRGLLKRQTGRKGVLLKPSRQLLPYLGDSWDERYEKAYEPRTAVTPKAGRVVVEFARLMRDYQDGAKNKKHDPQDFQARLEKVLDVDEFLRYLAVTVVIANADSPLLFPHNYYLAIPSKPRRVLWIPWDLNNSIGGMGQWIGVPLKELSIYRPTNLPLILQILEVPEFKERYTKIVRELIHGPCSARQLTAVYRAAQKTVARAIADEATRSWIVTKAGGPGGGWDKGGKTGKKGKAGKRGKKGTARRPDFEEFFLAREQSVLDQLAGRSQGVSLTHGKKKGAGKKFDAKAYLAGARKKFRAMVAAGEMTAEEAEARIAELKKKIGGSSKGASKKSGGSGKKGTGKKGTDKNSPDKKPAATAPPLATSGPHWNQFRGPNGDGKSSATKLPVEFSETKNLRWKTAIHDKGFSSPVIWGNQIWLTTGRTDGRELFAICVDLENGDILHDIKVFDVANPQLEYAEYNSHASPTPVVEAGRVYAHFGTYGTACLDTKTGEKLWERRDLNCDHRVRPASSPILDGNSLFAVFDGVDVQFIVALDKRTGDTIWRKQRVGSGFVAPKKWKKPNDNRKSYATPTIIEHEGRRQLISPAAEVTISYDPKTGEELWRVIHQGWGWNVTCRPLYAHGLVYVTTGAAKRLLAIRPSGTGDVTDTHVAWVGRRAIPSIPSPLLVRDLLFMVNDQGGVASCLEARTGTGVWRKRLVDVGEHWASPLYADGKIYFFSKDGDVSVISAAREFELLAENRIDGSLLASPAIAGDAMILRSLTHLYCFVQGATGGVGKTVPARSKAQAKPDATVDLAELSARLKAAVKSGKMTEEEALAEWQRAAKQAGEQGKGKQGKGK